MPDRPRGAQMRALFVLLLLHRTAVLALRPTSGAWGGREAWREARCRGVSRVRMTSHVTSAAPPQPRRVTVDLGKGKSVVTMLPATLDEPDDLSDAAHLYGAGDLLRPSQTFSPFSHLLTPSHTFSQVRTVRARARRCGDALHAPVGPPPAVLLRRPGGAPSTRDVEPPPGPALPLARGEHQ